MIKTNEPSTIWRYDLPEESLVGDVALALREKAQLLAVDMSHRSGVAALWFLIPQASVAGAEGCRVFRAFGTGKPIPAGYTYLASTGEGPLVWHIFERTER